MAVGRHEKRRGLLLGIVLILLVTGMATSRQANAEPSTNRPSHHTEDGFRNPWLEQNVRFGEFLKWRFGMGPDEKPVIPSEDVPEYTPAYATVDMARIQAPDPKTLQITWIGHSTFLIQAGGLTILTDPQFSKRASPVGFAGPERQARVPIALTNLPPVDLVLISHNHYDHLDTATIKTLGNAPRYVVPLKVGEWFNDLDITNVIELDWWQTAAYSNCVIHAVPAQHFSSRSMTDRNETLWCGYVIETGVGRVYFAGDTGYGPFFTEIGEKLGPMNVAMMPIGAYRPRWFMKPMHLDPPEALQVHKDVRSRLSIGMHWGTFVLSDEPLGEPAVYLEKARKEAGVATNAFRLMKFGESITVSTEQ